MKRLLRWAVAVAFGRVLVLAHGDPTDPWVWAYVAGFAAVSGFALLSIDEDLARERFTPPEPGADRLPLRAVRFIALGHIVLSLIDGRMGWSEVPAPLRAIGLAGFVGGFSVIVLAMRANRFFSAVVRIQRDRGHRVVDAGPYAWLRHPGYAAMILAIPLGGLALGSWYGALAGLLYSGLILRRVIFEDRFLQQNLEGYRDYAQRVRYRLVPGVW